MSEALRRRIERLEREKPPIVLLWKDGVPIEEALRVRFGAGGAPAGAEVYVLSWADGSVC